MKAVGFHEHGDVDVLTDLDLPEPTPGPGEVVVDVKAVALNHLDVWVRRGMAGGDLPKPFVLGSDIAGMISAVGQGVTDAKVGDEVVLAPGVCCGRCSFCLSGEDSLCADYGILGETTTGGYAQRIAVPAGNALPKPKGLSFPEAAAFPLTFLTAWRMLVNRAQVKAGETVLITGASAGVGVAAIQIAKLHGATVIAATRGPEKQARAKALGADHVVDSEDLKKAVRAIVGREGVEVVFEHVGGETFKTALGLLRRGGRLVTCGATSGFLAEIDLRHLFIKQQSILGSTMGSRADLLRIVKLVEAGRLKPIVDVVLPLSQAKEAHKLLEERKHFGKVVLTP
ncbi:MAG: zinc-binding dehydrogenase [Myxococcota bacterium]